MGQWRSNSETLSNCKLCLLVTLIKGLQRILIFKKNCSLLFDTKQIIARLKFLDFKGNSMQSHSPPLDALSRHSNKLLLLAFAPLIFSHPPWAVTKANLTVKATLGLFSQRPSTLIQPCIHLTLVKYALHQYCSWANIFTLGQNHCRVSLLLLAYIANIPPVTQPMCTG